MIIPQLGSPLCHMPDLSAGRRMQLPLLSANQSDGGVGVVAEAVRCGSDAHHDAKELAPLVCCPIFPLRTPNVWPKRVKTAESAQQQTPSLTTSIPKSLLISSLLAIHHPAAQTHSTLRAALRAQQLDSKKKDKNIRKWEATGCLYQSSSSGESR